MMDV